MGRAVRPVLLLLKNQGFVGASIGRLIKVHLSYSQGLGAVTKTLGFAVAHYHRRPLCPEKEGGISGGGVQAPRATSGPAGCIVSPNGAKGLTSTGRR